VERAAGSAGEEWDDEALLDAIERGSHAAYAAFLDRYHGLLLRYARRARFPESACEEVIGDVLADAIMALMAKGTRRPSLVSAYVIGCFRHRMLNEARTLRRRARHVREAAERAADPDADADAEASALLCSSYSVRESRGRDRVPPALPPAIERLATMLDEALSDEERQMLAWASEDMPQRLVASWLGISLPVARKRRERLRRRLELAALRHAVALGEPDAAEVRRFLARCGLMGGQGGRPPPDARDAPPEDA
jgi:RNA polymerase sigma factor (sigma-70 family)